MSFGGLLIFRERYSWRQWCGVGILTIGLVLFFYEKLTSIITAQTNYLLGTTLVVLGAVAWAVYALTQKQSQSNFIFDAYHGNYLRGMCFFILTIYNTKVTFYT